MDIEQRIADFNRTEMERIRDVAEAEPEPEPEEGLEPVDLYQRDRVRMRDINNKSFPRGSSRIVYAAVDAVVDGRGAEGLARAFRRAKDDSDSLKARGEQGRAEIRRKQYMNEYFLPAVEAVTNSSSPDELLTNERALNELDKYVLLEGSGRGYTASYLRQAYGDQLGQVEGRSDASVRSGVRRINMALDSGEVRTAVGLANKLKDKLDKGEAMADENDAELIGRIVAYYS